MKRPHRSIPIRLASRIHSLIFPPLVNIHYNGLDAPNVTLSRSLPDILVKGQMICPSVGWGALPFLFFLEESMGWKPVRFRANYAWWTNWYVVV